jgi:hypothetical protein
MSACTLPSWIAAPWRQSHLYYAGAPDRDINCLNMKGNHLWQVFCNYSLEQWQWLASWTSKGLDNGLLHETPKGLPLRISYIARHCKLFLGMWDNQTMSWHATVRSIREACFFWMFLRHGLGDVGEEAAARTICLGILSANQESFKIEIKGNNITQWTAQSLDD